MFGWFGEVGGTRENHTHRCVSSFYYLAERKVRKTSKIIFEFLTLVIRHRFFFFVPETPNPFWGNLKRRAPEFGSKSAPSKVDLVNYGAIWCQIGSQFLSPKTCEFSMEAAGAADKNQDWTPRQNLPAA